MCLQHPDDDRLFYKDLLLHATVLEAVDIELQSLNAETLALLDAFEKELHCLEINRAERKDRHSWEKISSKFSDHIFKKML